ncbi:hypothetical protein CFP56_027785 [Quercus suber]|uniref:Uncharacterized protein n=1 Tax=Quercus suber TaxID=58331 RepID=A0AAW0LVR0_QUESU
MSIVRTPCPPFPKSFTRNFPSPKTHNLFSHLFHSFNPKLWRACGATDSSCVSQRDSRDRWPLVQLKNHHPSLQN